MSGYEECVGGSLKLKGSASGGVKKKKKRSKAKEVMQTLERVDAKETKSKAAERTPAEKAFLKTQEKRQGEKILKLAEKTHKQRVEELNTYLDSLTEHYDIPKVSWTK